MSTRSSSSNLVPPFSDPESVIRNRRRNLGDPSLLLDFEEINMNPINVQGPPSAGPPPQNHNGPPGLNLQNPVPDLRTMEELCQPTMNGQCGPIAPVNIQATDFRLKNHMIQQSMKQNGVTYDALRFFLFLYSLTHHVTAWFDRLPKNSIHTFEEMVSKFLFKYFPPMVTKLRNEISNFRQLRDESLFEAWERFKLSIDRCPNHNMFPVNQIDTFYNGLTLGHHDTINVVSRGTFMKRRSEECYDLIENMTAHHNDWVTSAQRGESSSSITSSSPEITTLSQQTCGGPHYYFECQVAGGYTQDVYATTRNYNAGANQMIKVEKAFNERPQGGLPSNTVPNPGEDVKVIITRSGITLAGPSVSPPNPLSSSKEVERDPEPTMDQVHISSPDSTARVPSPVVQPTLAYPHQPPIPYPSSFAEALALMPKYAKMLKDLLSNKEKLLELANTPLTENCSAVLLKKLPEKLRDPGKFLIPCDFSELEEL
ncbi:reverse transcriptase domain-containing protein [Tanacetum coccineum]